MGAQLELVDKYSSLRNKGAVDEVLCLVTDNINLESTLNTAKGKSQFEAYLRKQQRSGDVEPATDVHGVPTVRGRQSSDLSRFRSSRNLESLIPTTVRRLRKLSWVVPSKHSSLTARVRTL
jgi:hypothetical protein